MRAINSDDIPYTMLYKEDWMRGTGVEKQAAWKDDIDAMPTIEPEREKGEWTKKELIIFAKGIARSLISKRLAQHWHYDDDTAKEIEFLETLYKKVMEIILYD